MNFTDEEITLIVECVAAMLIVGNLKFENEQSERCYVKNRKVKLIAAAIFLQINSWDKNLLIR